MINNPYIEKVLAHPKIFTDTEKIYSKKWNWEEYFWDDKPLILEIWTGLWNFFSSQVIDHPENNYIAMEIRYKRLYKTAEKSAWFIKNNDNTQHKHIENLSVKNENFVVLKDFWENIDKIFEKNELTETYVFFPDPWDKSEKTRRKRLVQFWFLEDLYKITKKDWKLFFKTDHKWYFDFVLEEIKNTKWELSFKTYDYEKDWLYDKNKITEFEQIFRWQDLKVNYLELTKR